MTEELELFKNQNASTRLLINNPTSGASGDSGVTYQVNSSVAAQWYSNANTTFYSNVPTGTGFSWRINDSDQVVINSSGNVGIASTSPYAKLSITNTGSGPSFVVEDDTSPDSTPFIIDASGNVGIGTTDPSQKLDVNGSVRLRGGSSTYYYNGNNDNYSRIFGGDASNNYLAFSTNSEMMRITNAGNVGIGTSSPAEKLHLYTTSATRMKLDTSATNQDVSVSFANNNTDKAYLSYIGSTFGGDRQDTLELYTGSGIDQTFLTGGSERMRIDASTGNIGIGTSSPTQSLTVYSAAAAALIRATTGVSSIYAELSSGTNNSDGPKLTLDASSAWNIPAHVLFGRSGTTYWGLGLLGSVTIGDDFYIANSANDASTPEFLIQRSTGNVGIATTSPWRTLSVTGTVGFDGLTVNTGGVTSALCLDSNKQVTQNTDNETCVASSARFKHNIETLSASTSIALVQALKPVTFEYINAAGTRFGLIAEDVELVEPRLVSYDGEGLPQAVRYTDLIPLLIKTLQELMAAVANFADQFVSAEITATNKLCIGVTCITETQLQALLQNAGEPAPSDDEDEAATSDAEPTQANPEPPATTEPVASTTEATIDDTIPVVPEDPAPESTPEEPPAEATAEPAPEDSPEPAPEPESTETP